MQLVIISGLSGAGKSVALATLEDEGYYCVDNLPTSMLVDLARRMMSQELRYDRVAVGIDARGETKLLDQFGQTIDKLQQMGVNTRLLFLDASAEVLMQRFSETRRKHPLSRMGAPLASAIATERHLLEHMATNANVRIDTTHLNLHQLREVIRSRLLGLQQTPLNVLLQSFGFKHGAPVGTDFIFDVRCLPNPYWDTSLRPLTGRDPAVAEFLSQQQLVQNMIEDIHHFFRNWLPVFERENRAYLTISIGCTGGRHRSVFMVENIYRQIRSQVDHVTVKHRELD